MMNLGISPTMIVVAIVVAMFLAVFASILIGQLVRFGIALLLIPLAGVVLLYIRAKSWGIDITLRRALAMRSRRIKVGAILRAAIAAKKARLSISLDQFEAHALAGGQVQRLVQALAAAAAAGVELDFDLLARIDLIPSDPLAAVTQWLESGSRDPQTLQPAAPTEELSMPASLRGKA